MEKTPIDSGAIFICLLCITSYSVSVEDNGL